VRKIISVKNERYVTILFFFLFSVSILLLLGGLYSFYLCITSWSLEYFAEMLLLIVGAGIVSHVGSKLAGRMVEEYEKEILRS
jgi:hypothetical protein